MFDRSKFPLAAALATELMRDSARTGLTPPADPQHQHANWNAHKVDCKDLVKMRFADVEQRRRDADWSPAPAPADADAAVRDGTH